MKKINFDPQIFINLFKKEINNVEIKVPSGTLTDLVNLAKTKFTSKYNNDIIVSLGNFEYNKHLYKQYCKITPATGELGYEITQCKTNKSVFSFVYSGSPLPEFISTVDDVKSFFYSEMKIENLLSLKDALQKVYIKGFSEFIDNNKSFILIYEKEILYCKERGHVKKEFYIPEIVFNLGVFPTLQKYLDLCIDDYDVEDKTLNDFKTYGFEDLKSFITHVTTDLNLTNKELIYILSNLLNSNFYKYKNYSFSVDGLLIPALIIQIKNSNSTIDVIRFVLTNDLLKELFIEICNFNKTDNFGLNTFQLAKELTDILNLPEQQIFQIFNDITLATIENKINLLDNYTLYIYVKEGKALLYHEDVLIEEFFINKKIFNGIRIDYYHYLSNF